MGAFRSRARRNAAADLSLSNRQFNADAADNGDAKNGLSKDGNARNGSKLALVAPPLPAVPTPRTLMSQVQEERTRKILQTIESKPRCTMDDLAEEFKLSHSHLQHLVKEETGVGLGHLLAEQRLTRAAQLLSSSNLSIKEIADTVGYEHASSFIRAFERRFTQPPRVYRRLNVRPK
jgi:AraC-like DNA-binding protein